MNKKKIFMIITLFIFVMSLSCVSASENDTVLALSETNDISGISNVNASDIDDEIIGNSIESESLLGANKKEAKINLTRSTDGIIEDDSISITATFMEADGTPIAGETIHSWLDGHEYGMSQTTDENGQFVFNVAESSGFHYFKVFFKSYEKDKYVSCESKMIELAFANDNTLVDLAVRSLSCKDGVLNLTKDYTGYGSNDVVRRDENNYDNITYNKDKTKLNEIGILVNSNLIVNGNGHTIDLARYEDLTCLFVVNNCKLTLNDMALLNAYVSNPNYNVIKGSGDSPTINLNNVSVINSTTITGAILPTPIIGRGLEGKHIILNCINSTFIGNDVGSIFPIVMKESLIEGCTFLNNAGVLYFVIIADVDFKSNIFLNNSKIFEYPSSANWERGNVIGNYWGTNDSSVIESIRPSGSDISMVSFDNHSYLTIDGNSTFCEDDVQDYDIYFSGSGASKLPTYKTVISYTHNNSTINNTNIVLSSNKTTVRVSPKSYGLETLTVEPNLYVLPINITKSTKLNYNVSVDAPETEYSIPLNIVVNVCDVDNNTVTTTADVTINGDTNTININDGVGTLTLNDLVPGT